MCSDVSEIEDKIEPKENKRKDIQNEIKQKVQENGYFNCKKCPQKFISKVVFEIHLKMKHGSDSLPLVIKQCSLAQDTKTLQNQKVNEKLRPQQKQKSQKKITPHQCLKCNKAFGRQYIRYHRLLC